MKLVFLEIDTERTWALASVGPAYIASYLRQHGHQCEMLRLPMDISAGEIRRRVAASAPDLLGVSLTTRQWQRSRKIVAELRQQLAVPVIAGGLHPTFSPQDVLAAPGFDFVCLGEGEQATLELMERLQDGDFRRSVIDGEGLAETATPMANIWWHGGERPSLRPPLEPDALPPLARDHLDEPPGVTHVNTQRGCPFPCTYCAARNYHDLYRGLGNYGRRRSDEAVLAELAAVDDTIDLSYVVFLDDTFTLDRRWVMSFCQSYGRRFGVPFSINARVETVDRELLAALADAGCRHVIYGVESGSERLRREVMGRPVTDQQFVDAFAWSREAGLLITANYMMGLPEETEEELDLTLALHRRLQPDDFGYFVFYPYPGTRLFKVCRDSGYLPPDYSELEANHRRSVLHLPSLGADAIAAAYDRFTAERDAHYRNHFGGEEDDAVLERQIQGCAATG